MEKEELLNNTIAFGSLEITQRYGSAGAEFLKGLNGVDNETGKIFDRSLKKISESKVHPDFVKQNIKQQAGFSSEVASVSRKNAKSIIEKSNKISIRTEDVEGYGKNDSVVDILTIENNKITTIQQKFVTDHELLLKKIAKGDGSGAKNDLSRYLKVDRLEVPTEKVELMKQHCKEQSQILKEQSKIAYEKGNTELAKKFDTQAKNYQKLEDKISDSGLTTEEAIKYRTNPRLMTAKDIAKNSHNAGLQGAKLGAAIGGGISILTNIFSVATGDKEFGKGIKDIAEDTLKSAGVGYGTAFVGSACKSFMQQSSKESIRLLSKTGLPAMVVSTCLSLQKDITKYVKGECTTEELLQNIALISAGMTSSSLFSIIGQIAIPVPILGGLVGGLIGYTFTNMFFNQFFAVLKNEKLAKEERILVEMQCEAAIAIAKKYKKSIDDIFENKLKHLNIASENLLNVLNDKNVNDEEFCTRINEFANVLGKQLPIKNIKELDAMMESEDVFLI